MSRSISSRFIVIGHKNFGENDKLVTLYNNEHGKIRVIARGARKISSKFTGHLETLNTCKISLYFGPRNTIITEISPDREHKNIPDDLESLSGALQIAEITNQLLFENQCIENLEELIRSTTKQLSFSKRPSLISMAYIIKLLDLAGHIPDFKETKTSLPEKYSRFFHFLKNSNYGEIEKVSLKEEEKYQITSFLKKIIELNTERTFHSFI